MLLRLTDNPIYQAETRHLRRPERPVQWGYVVGRVLLFIPVALIACIPSVIYVDGLQDNWLNLMLLTAILVQVALTVRAAAVTTHVMRNEYTSGNWDLLRLTNISARQLVTGKWLAAFRLVWFDFALFSIIKLGLAVAFVHYLNLTWTDPSTGSSPYLALCPQNWPTTLDRFTCYVGIGFVSYPAQEFEFQPSVVTFLMALTLNCVFSLFEIGIATAISIWLNIRFEAKLIFLYVGAVVIIRTLLIVIVYLYLLMGTERFITRSNIYPPYAIGWDETTRYRMVGTLNGAFLTMVDFGVLTNANIMRPESAFIHVIYEVKYQNGIGYEYLSGPADTRPFVFRNIVAALLGMGLYALLIRYFLHQAQIVAIRQHGLRGVVEV